MKELTLIVENLAIETELELNNEMKYIFSSNDSMNIEELYSYLSRNNNKTKYVVTFCYDR